MLRTSVLISFLLLILCPATSFAWHDYSGDDGGWDYHGSGRDQPYSYYVDRYYYIGPADYAPIPVDFIDEPLTLTPTPAPVPITTLPTVQAEEIPVNIPDHRNGGYITVVLKRSGSGYLGPKGEFYPEFPKVFQLEMTYGGT